jgi:hypothetical protein
MRKIIPIIGIVFIFSIKVFFAQQTDKNLKATDPSPQNAIEFILDAFDRYSVVALGEGNHMNWQAATFRLQLIRDPRFPQKIKNILVECGTSRYQDIMDRYTAGENIPMEKVRSCWRETTQPVIWDAPIYEEFFKAVRQLNRSLPKDNQLRVLLCDPPIDWSKIHTREDLENYYNERMIARPWGKSNIRDGHAHDVLVKEVLSKGEKALAIFGDAHFAKPDIELAEGFFGDYLRGNLMVQLGHSHPGSALSITTHTGLKEIESSYPEILSWPKPSIAVLNGTRLGAIPHGPLHLEDFFDAILWLGPISTISYSKLVYETVADESYFKEALRRDKLWISQFQSTLTGLRKEYLEKMEQTDINGPYLGQKPPGMTAEIFAPDIVSTGHGEFCSVFSPEGDEFYWSIAGAPFPVIAVMRQSEGRWTAPEIASFSGKYLDLDMAFSPDGKSLYFCSRRPAEGDGPPTAHTDFWFVERDGVGWSEPRRLQGPVNSDGQEYYPIFAQNKTLYFCSTRPGGQGGGDIYRARFAKGAYLEPENLGPPINTANFEGDLFIAADESYIIVTCYDRPDSFGSGDLYIGFRREDGTWSPLKNMGAAVNTAANEHCPMLSPEGKYLFFSSGRTRHPDYSKTAITYSEKIRMMNSWGNGRNEDIYWIDARIIDNLRSR